MKVFAKTLSILFALLLSSCATTEKRIEANADLFATFSSENQSLIREEKIDIGFTPQMVEISQGEPTYINIRTTADQEITVWRYTQLRQYSTTQPIYISGNYGGTEWVDITNVMETERLRVEFIDGKVSSFEKVQPN